MPTVPLLASIADLSASVTSGGASQLVPSGVVMAFAGATAPTGWLLCNGAAVSRVTYADLFAAIGTAHGYGDNVAVTGTFNLPDYRGRFIRGRDTMGTAASRDPDKASRTFSATGGNTGDAVGSVQTNAAARPNTAFTTASSAVTGTTQIGYVLNASAGGDRGSPTTATDPLRSGTINATNSLTAAASSVTGGGDLETRPTNAYVNYIIKI